MARWRRVGRGGVGGGGGWSSHLPFPAPTFPPHPRLHKVAIAEPARQEHLSVLDYRDHGVDRPVKEEHMVIVSMLRSLVLAQRPP